MNTNANATLTIEELESTLNAIAGIIKLHGDVYLPIFRRVYDELNAARQNQEMRDIAMKLISNHD